MSSPFKTAADVTTGGAKITDFEGALCIFTYVEDVEVETERYGLKPAVKVNIDCVKGVPAGTLSKMPPQGFGAQPTALADRTGESYNNVLVFQGFLRGEFRGLSAGDRRLGRVGVEGKVTKASISDKDLKASWVLHDATDPADVAAAVAVIEKKNAAQFVPAGASATQGGFDADPPF